MKIMKKTTLASGSAFLGAALFFGGEHQAAAQAPPPAQPPVAVPQPGYAPAVRYPDNGFSFMRHSSTVAEGAYRGAAEYARALGAANYDNSLAAMNYQEAYRRSLENTLKYAETYYAKRDLWFDYREAYGRKPLTMEGYRRLAESAAPDRLQPEHYDAEAGVRWPSLLRAEVLAPYRQAIDQAMAARSGEDAGLGSETYAVVRQMTGEMREILDRHVGELPTHLYVHATKFLDSVRYEARFAGPVDVSPENGNGAPAGAVPAPPVPPADGQQPAENPPVAEDQVG